MEKIKQYIPHLFFALLFLLLVPQAVEFAEYAAIKAKPVDEIVDIKSVTVENITTEQRVQQGTINRDASGNIDAMLLRELSLYKADESIQYVCAVRKDILFEEGKSTQTFPIDYADNGCGLLEPGDYYWQFQYRFQLPHDIVKKDTVKTNIFSVTEPE